MTNRLPTRLGSYTLGRSIGKGGFAEVFLGEHVHLHTEAAIKVLQVQLVEDERANFLREAQILFKLTHPHIIHMLDFGVENDTPFLVMEYAPNGNLRRRHAEGQTLALDTIITYIEQVAGALARAHAQGLIHRDVKPENMLVGSDNEILLSDFGTAIVVQSTHSLRNVDAIGTAAYMAPEQIEGRPHLASDQYALGVVVYEWLCGRRPFNGTVTEILAQHTQKLPPPLPAQIVPAAVAQVVMRALSKNPQDRFQGIKDFSDALAMAARSTTDYAEGYAASNSSTNSAAAENNRPIDHDAMTLLQYQKTAPLTTSGTATGVPQSLAAMISSGRHQLRQMIDWLKKELGLDTYWLHAKRYRLFLNSGIICNIGGSLILGLRLNSIWALLGGLIISLTTFLLFYITIRRSVTTVFAIILAAYWAVLAWGLPANTIWVSMALFIGSLLIHLRYDARKRT